MKFQSVLDAHTFLAEIRVFDKLLSGSVTEKYQPTTEELDTFISGRREYVRRIKDHRKSANQKANWRENRTKMMGGIKAFHRSVDGKRFHRKMGRFLATRITKNKNEEYDYPRFRDQLDTLSGLNSLKQHLLTELSYFHRIQEQIELEEIVIDHAIPMFRSIEDRVIKNEGLSDDELDFLLDMTDTSVILSEAAKLVQIEEAEILRMYEDFIDKIEKEGIAKDRRQFYPVLVENFISTLGENQDAKKDE